MKQKPDKPNLKQLLPPELARTFGAERGDAAARPLGIEVLDKHLGGGVPLGAVVEVAGTDAAWWLAMRVVAASGKACALVDHDHTFYPPGAAAAGVDLSRLLIVRETRKRQAQWALERLARDKNIAVTVAWLDGLSETFMRRLQLAAEASGQTVVLTPPTPGKSAHWCALRLRVRPEPTTEGARAMTIEITKSRGGAMPRPVRVEVDDETYAVRSSAVSANGTADARLGDGTP